MFHVEQSSWGPTMVGKPGEFEPSLHEGGFLFSGFEGFKEMFHVEHFLQHRVIVEGPAWIKDLIGRGRATPWHHPNGKGIVLPGATHEVTVGLRLDPWFSEIAWTLALP